MPRIFADRSRRRFILRTAVPMFGAGLLITLVGTVLLYWSTERADTVAVERQRVLVELVLSKLMSSVAHEQESVTVWDDALQAVEDYKNSREWVDTNLGSWMFTYFGHDGAFVLSPNNDVIYASSGGSVAGVSAFHELQPATTVLVDDLRSRLRAGDQKGVSDRVLTPGAADIAMVDGRPAVVSVKPIVSDTGEITVVPGQEYLHVALRYLDSSLLQELRHDYLFEGLRFAWRNNAAGGEAASPLKAVSGELMGYFIWSPLRPGSAVRADILPVLIVLSAIGFALLALLLAGLRRRSVNLRRSQEVIRHLAAHDVLTGLPNRAQFATRLDNALQKTRTMGEKVALLYLDLDRFKQVNDTLGHPAGDELLREFADRLRRLTRDCDTVARLSGDEFTIILRNVGSVDDAEHLCRRIIESARHPFDVAGTQVFVGVSVGVAIAPCDGIDRIEITRRADVALYSAKARGRSEFAIFSPDMDRLIKERRDLERDLRHALDVPGQLQVYYQPLFDAKSHKLTGIEALVRWHHPDRGSVAPDIFIPLAEETGLIERVGEFVLKEAAQTAVHWPVATLAVNVSAIELKNAAYAVRVAAILMSCGMDPKRLELEVTESALADTHEVCVQNITALRELGVRFALDDFGTGFSSLSRLQQLDVDRIKIDRSFVQGFGSDNGDEAIVRAIVDLARATGLRTTAEGVETQEQDAFLRSIGCDELQGFLFSKPVSRLDLPHLISEASAANARLG